MGNLAGSRSVRSLVVAVVAATVVVVTAVPALAATAPVAPTSVAAGPRDAGAQVTWVAPANGGSALTGYTVTPYQGSTAGTPVHVSGTTLAAFVGGLTNGLDYSFHVTATNAIGTGPEGTSPVIRAGAPRATPTPAAVAGDSRAVVQWQEPVENASIVTGFIVTPKANGVAQAPVTFTTNQHAQVLTGLTNGVSYTFSVAAVNARGTGPTSNFSAAVTPRTSGVTALSAGHDYACALRSTGTVGCWGFDETGQLGLSGSFVNRTAAVTIPGLSGATAVATGQGFACAIVAAGAVKCWGGHTDGQLGNGVNDSGYTTSPVSVTGITGATAITAGGHHACVVVALGAVKCWGLGTNGELGNSASSTSSTPVAVTGLTGVTRVAAGETFTCAIAAAGAVECWGDNVAGDLGNNSGSLSNVPVGVSGLGGGTPTSSATLIGLGDTFACARRGDATAVCWGYNGQGELGNGNNTSQPVPVVVSGLTGVIALGVGRDHACAVVTGGTSKCWGGNGVGQLATTGYYKNTPASTPSVTGATAVVSGGTFSCVLKTGGLVQCWGDNDEGQLGRGTAISVYSPVAITGVSSVGSAAPGSGQICSTVAFGLVKCWGNNDRGSLGNGTNTSSVAPVTVTGLSGSTAIGPGGGQFECVVAAGLVRCWGYGSHGVLGNGLFADSNKTVTAVGISGATQVSTSYAHACAIVAAGAVKCWGAEDANGQLGDGGSSDSAVPVSVTGLTGATAIAVNPNSTCAIVAAGAVKCWGANNEGQLGNGTLNPSPTPIAVPGITGAKAIAASGDTTCVILADKTVSCWGWNGSGVTGTPPGSVIVQSPTPVPGITGATGIALSGYVGCVDIAGGAVRCWGDNSYGSLGVGDTASHSGPVTVVNLGGPAAIFGGGAYICAKVAGGLLRCWGHDMYGEMGDSAFLKLGAPNWYVVGL